ncbi:MAG TPA: cupin domain-containing protein [Pyrinomonadaceae bacterium]|nr:cupin domain-containing protein [Pyrinomonadaceae bacterium]
MNTSDLEQLNTAVKFLIGQKTVLETIERLDHEVDDSAEPFVWSVIELDSIAPPLPDIIKSCWIFVLKKNVPSGCHYHPNSIQHMFTIKGQGRQQIAGQSQRMVSNKWIVIDKNVPHEFFPEDENMVVISFHTCDATELEEIGCDTGGKRLYTNGTN